jgi:hypothetical protein
LIGESDDSFAFENFGADKDLNFNLLYEEFKLSYCPGPGKSDLSI